MKAHVLKCEKEIYDRVRSGEKTFEVRKDDRHFQTGDRVTLTNYRGEGCLPPDTENPPLSFTIGFVLRGGQFGLEPGYVAFSIFPAEPIKTPEELARDEAFIKRMRP